MINNDRLLKALQREPHDCPPVWIMRQAGRYLPEYRATREKAGSFLNLCKTPELACEVTMQPLRRFDLDASIIFSDILTIPDAMGLGLYFTEGEGPHFEKTIQTATDIQQLRSIDPETELRYVMDAIRLAKKEINQKVPLLGFSGSPFTLATYMVEGGASKQFTKIKKMLFCEPSLLQQLLQHLTKAIIDYLSAQIAAGVDVVMLFDTWGGILTTEDYQQFSLHYMKLIIQHLKQKYNIPVILFTKGSGNWLIPIAESGCDAVGLDWTIDIATAKKQIGDKVALQGNLDPSVLYAEPKKIEQAVTEILKGYGKGYGHIFNLGHGIQQDTDPNSVTVLIETVHKYSKA